LLEMDLATVEPSLAGPRRPQDRVALTNLKQSFWTAMKTVFNREIQPDDASGRGYIRWVGEAGSPAEAEETPSANRANLYRGYQAAATLDGQDVHLTHGSTVIAAITSCTNTSNPSVMVAAGLLAKKAVERGLAVQAYV